jgi:uncharacterized membrane protein YgcG
VETDDRDSREAGDDDGNVIRFPRDWIGPLEELVPIGVRARREPAERQEAGAGDEQYAAPPAADDFWSEGASAVHDVIQAPAGPALREAQAARRAHRRSVAPAHRRRRVFLAAAAAVAAVVAAGVVTLALRGPSHPSRSVTTSRATLAAVSAARRSFDRVLPAAGQAGQAASVAATVRFERLGAQGLRLAIARVGQAGRGALAGAPVTSVDRRAPATSGTTSPTSESPEASAPAAPEASPAPADAGASNSASSSSSTGGTSSSGGSSGSTTPTTKAFGYGGLLGAGHSGR